MILLELFELAIVCIFLGILITQVLLPLARDTELFPISKKKRKKDK